VEKKRSEIIRLVSKKKEKKNKKNKNKRLMQPLFRANHKPG
jgi:hypothetical protein